MVVIGYIRNQTKMIHGNIVFDMFAAQSLTYCQRSRFFCMQVLHTFNYNLLNNVIFRTIFIN